LEPETTNIRVIDPTTHPCPPHACPPPCALPPPHPRLQRTHRRHHRRQHRPPLPLVAPAASCHLLHHYHSTPLEHKAKHTPDKPPCQIASNSIFHSLAPKITMLGDSWVEDCCTWFIVFGFLQCRILILFDRILQWEEQRERKRQ
jgi:hypothetical protein